MASMKKSAIHEMTRLSKENEDVAFLSWVKPTGYKVRKKSEIQISKCKPPCSDDGTCKL
jgi:hypothetical protein